MTPSDFIAKWGPAGSQLAENERQGAQAFFLDLCELLGVPKPGSEAGYVFEKQTLALGQTRGFADVFWPGRFAWENKAPGKSLDGALRQLLGYSLALANPPLLIVSDRLTTRVHTQFNGHPSESFSIQTEDLADPKQQQLLRRVWLDPESFRPKQTNRDITAQAAHSFAKLADSLRKRGPQTSPECERHAEEIAHFLTQTLFCFFAEDVGLLPGRMFEQILNNRRFSSSELTQTLQRLLDTMRDGGPFGADYVPWFNGGLFKTVRVPKLEIIEITELRNAAQLNWSAIDVSIFGTLFERGLDPAKRSQLGAHYTDPATIERIIEPVVRRPLLQNWERAAQEIQGLQAKNTKKASKEARDVYVTFLQSLQDFKILDPACGSGNFLFLGLKALKDLEHQVITEAEVLGLERPVDLVTGPANMLGIELNEYAAELARVTVWIGELQWRMEHGYPFKDNPVLEPLDVIEHRDALLVQTPVHPEPVEGVKYTYSEADWPKVSVVIGNPPFLGDKKMRGELGDEYVTALRKTYQGRVPGGADLVCYWFEKARAAIEIQGLGAAGLVSTNSIRGGKNRFVLEAICKTTRIYTAWSDEEWVNDGAAVRVSLVALGWGECCYLNGKKVDQINADLTGGLHAADSTDLTIANSLSENEGAALQGPTKGGSFDVSGQLAREWIRSGGNPNGLSNALVLKPWFNGESITGRRSDSWIIDFAEMRYEDACLFAKPFDHVAKHVKPARDAQRMPSRKRNWWIYNASAPKVRDGIAQLPRYIVTPEVAKHRVFAWLPSGTAPDKNLIIFLRSDDTNFGILHSRFHEVWALRMGTSLEDRPRYTSSTTVRTFPFPAGLTPRDTAHQRTESLEGGAQIPAGLESTVLKPNQPLALIKPAQSATESIVNSSPSPTFSLREQATNIARAAHRLNTLRENWLNPPEWTQRVPEVTPLGMDHSPYPDRILPRHNLSELDAKELGKRTLTNLYNQKTTGQAQWLQAAHEQLDQAVATAYGWADYTPAIPDEEILKRLLALNLARAEK
jgi:hypothetical protein